MKRGEKTPWVLTLWVVALWGVSIGVVLLCGGLFMMIAKKDTESPLGASPSGESLLGISPLGQSAFEKNSFEKNSLFEGLLNFFYKPKIVFLDLKRISRAIVFEKGLLNDTPSSKAAPLKGIPQGKHPPHGFEEEITKVMRRIMLIKRDFPQRTRFVFEEREDAEDYTDYFLKRLGLL